MADVVRRWLDEHPDLQAVAPSEAGTIPAPSPDVPDPGCSVFDEGEAGCKEQALEWAKREAIKAAPLAAGAGLVLLMGAWLIAVGAVAWYRKRI